MISFTDEENQLIEELGVAGGWDNEKAKPLKNKIKHILS